MYICKYFYMYIYTRMHICIYTYIHIYIYTYVFRLEFLLCLATHGAVGPERELLAVLVQELLAKVAPAPGAEERGPKTTWLGCCQGTIYMYMYIYVYRDIHIYVYRD